MAKPCRYQIAGQDTWMSEAELKKALNDGLLDTLMSENNVSIPSLKGFKPDPNKVESYKLGRGKGGKMTEDANLKPSIGYRSGNLDNKAETRDKFEAGNRSTGHFGTGFYFFGTEGQADNYDGRKTNTIDLSGYNLAKGTIELHDLLKDVNRYSIGTDKNADKLNYSVGKVVEYLNGSNNPKISRNASDQEFEDYMKSVNNQTNQVESIVNKINSESVDSPSTVVMKSLGFDGIDSRGTDLDNAKYGSVVYSAAPSATTTEETISEKAKSFAEKIRSGKIDTKGLAMSSVPGFNEAWNASLEIAAVTVEAAGTAADAIGKGIAAAEKAFKESEFYKSLQTREERLRYFNDLRNNIEQALTEKKMTGKEKAAAKEFGQTVNEVTGVKPAPKMITAKESDLLKARIKAQAASSRDTAKNLNNMKDEVRKFAKENLPKDVYTAREVGAIMTAITKAKTEKSVNDAIDRIQALSERKVEAARVAKAKDIAKTIKSKKTLYSKINDKWKGKVSVDAQQEFKDFIESLTDLESMSMDELQAVEDTINGILNEGKADLKRVKEIQDSRRRSENAKMLEELAGKPRILTDVAAINEFFDSVGGHVIVDGQLYNKSDFAKSAYNKAKKPATFKSAKGYDKIPADQARVISEETTSTTKKAGRWLKKSSILDSIYGQFQKIYKGAPEMKKFIDENISNPIKNYFVDSKIAKGKIFEEFKNGRAQIFGSQKNAAKRLDSHADVNPIKAMSDAGLKVKNTVLVSLYNLGKLTDGQERLKNSGVDVDMLNEYIENNPDLKQYSDFLIDQYASLRERYEPTYISIMNTTFPEGIYYPAYAAEGPIQDTFNEGDVFDANTNEFKALNAMVDNLKQRTNYKGPFNTTLTSEEIFSDYVNNMERAKALVPVAKSLNQLFNEANRPYIANKIGYRELTNLQKHLAVILTGKKPASNYSVGSIDTLMNWNVISTLGFKLASIPKQLASITHFWSAGIKNGINPAKVITAVPTTKAEFDFLKEIMGSEYLKERLSGSGLDVEVQRILATKTDRQYKKALKKVFQVGMYLPAAGDWLTITFPLGGGGSYAIAAMRNQLAKGKSLEEAKDIAFKQFVEAVEETQQTSREDYTSNFQREKMGRMILTYKSAQVGAARKITEGIRTLRDTKNASSEDKKQAFTDIIYYSAFSSVLFNLISNAGYDVFTNPIYDDDDELRVIYDLVMDQIGSAAQGFGMIGMIADWTLNASRDDMWKNNAPFVQFIANIANGGSSVVEALSKREWTDLTEEERARISEEMGLEKGYLTDNQLEELFEIYRNTSITQRMSPQDRDNLIKIFGVKNINEQIKDFTEFMEGNQSFNDAFMNYEQDYFEFAKRRHKQDHLFKFIFNDDYLKKEFPQDAVDKYKPVITNDKTTETEREGIDERW